MPFVMPFLRPLPHAEICELARRYQKTGDPVALDRLVRSHLALAHKLAYAFPRKGLELDDLFAEAYAGLVVAAQKFDPDNGAQLQTYAAWWIKAYLRRFAMTFQGPVRFGSRKEDRFAFLAIVEAGKKLKRGEIGIEGTSDAVVAAAAGVPEAVVRAVRDRMKRKDISLDEVATGARNSAAPGDVETLLDRLPDEGPLPDELAERQQEIEQTRDRVASVLARLNVRDRQIARDRFMRDEPRTLESLGKSFGISRERVRQLETRVRQRLESALAG